MTVEIGGLRALEIRKETPDPRRHMLVEQAALSVVRRLKAATDERRHDFAQRRRMIFRLVISIHPLDAELRKIIPKASKRTLIEKAGEVVRRVGQQFPAPKADEEIEIFALDRAHF